MARSYPCFLQGIAYAGCWPFAQGVLMELAAVVVVLILAGAAIPADPKILFYR
jgi:hypothetical protein